MLIVSVQVYDPFEFGLGFRGPTEAKEGVDAEEAGFLFEGGLGAEGDGLIEEGKGGGGLAGEEEAEGGEVAGQGSGVGDVLEGGGSGGVLTGGIESDGLFLGRGGLVNGAAKEGGLVGWRFEGGEEGEGAAGPGEVGEGEGGGGGEEPEPSVGSRRGRGELGEDGLNRLDGVELGEAGFASEVMEFKSVAGRFVEFFGEVAFDDVFRGDLAANHEVVTTGLFTR